MNKLDEQVRKLMRENDRNRNHVENLINIVADYYFSTGNTAIDEEAMWLLEELSELGFDSEVRQALGRHTDEFA